MTSKNQHKHKARDAAPPQPQKKQQTTPDSQEDVLILLSQQIQAKRNPSRYLEGWIRRFVRG